VLLTMSEKFTKCFLIKCIFEANFVLSFDIHNNIHQTFVTTNITFSTKSQGHHSMSEASMYKLH